MRFYVHLFLLVLTPFFSGVAEEMSALDALKILPKSEIKNLARVEAYEGTPFPKRWHFLVHDPNSQTGVREYVVAGSELVASRGISQFANRLQQSDVISNESLSIDTDHLAGLAEDYASVNGIEVSSLSYRLGKEGAEGKPVWKVDCRDAAGKVLGTLAVNAGEGTVMSHNGFAAVPDTATRLAAARTPDARAATPWNKRDLETAKKPDESTRSRKKTASASATKNKRTRSASASKRSSVKPEIRRAVPAARTAETVRERRNPIGNFFRRVFTR